MDDDLGFTWTELPVPGRRTSTDRVLFRFARAMPEVVWDAAVLEGNTFTFPEVQTLLDGVTVGGRKVSEQDQVLRLADAVTTLRGLVASDRFTLTKGVSDRLHLAVATKVAPPSGEGGENLRAIYAAGLDAIGEIAEPFHQALAYFAFGALQQFYFDGNKRTARLMACGHLMAHGYEAISVPAARKLEFNETMVEFYLRRDATRLLSFLAGCAIA